MVLRMKNGLVGLLSSSVIGIGLLMGINARADPFTDRVLGNAAHMIGNPIAGRYFEAQADNTEAYLAEEAANQRAKEQKARDEQIMRQNAELLRLQKSNLNQRNREYSEDTPKTTKPNLEDKKVYTANRWIDANRNGIAEDEEVWGVKTSFEEGEQMFIAIQNRTADPKSLREVIKDPRGIIIADWRATLNAYAIMDIKEELWEEKFKPLLEKSGVGNYLVEVYFNDQLEAIYGFNILRGNRETAPKQVIKRQETDLEDKQLVQNDLTRVTDFWTDINRNGRTEFGELGPEKDEYKLTDPIICGGYADNPSDKTLKTTYEIIAVRSKDSTNKVGRIVSEEFFLRPGEKRTCIHTFLPKELSPGKYFIIIKKEPRAQATRFKELKFFKVMN
jgi:hypothetical protein